MGFHLPNLTNLFAGLAQYFVEQFVRRSAVGKSVVVAVEIFHAVCPQIFFRHVVFRNLDPERVGAGAGPVLAAFLNLRLSRAGKQTIDKNLGRVGISLQRITIVECVGQSWTSAPGFGLTSSSGRS